MSSSADTYAEYVQRGENLIADGNFEKAIAAFTQASEQRPNAFWPYCRRGEALLQLRRWEEAESAFRHAIERAADMAEQAYWAHFGLGKALSRQASWDESIEAFRRAIELDSNQFWPVFCLGETYRLQARWEEAAASFQRAGTLRNDSFLAHFKAGEALAELERWSDAIKSYSAAQQIQPDSFQANFSLAEAYFHARRWAEAVESYLQANRCNADNFWSHLRLGESLSKLQRWEEAVSIHERADKLKPDLSAAQRSLVGAINKQACSAEAVARYELAIAGRPADFSLHFFLGLALFNTNEHERAIESFQKSIELNDSFWPAHKHLGQTYVELNRLQHAEESFRKAIDLSPTADAWTLLGKAVLMQDRVIDSIPAFIQAISRDRSHSPAYALLGSALERDGRSADAIALYRHAKKRGVANEQIERRLAFAEESFIERTDEPVVESTDNGSDISRDRIDELSDINKPILFVLCNDYGELSLAMYLLEGQPFARNTTLLLPPRLFKDNPDILTGRTVGYQSPDDILHEIGKREPGILGLFSGYLLPTHQLCGSGALDSLLRRAHAAGWQSFTSDPFLGLTEGGQERRELVARRSGDACSLEDLFIDLLAETHTTLRRIPHVYPLGLPPTETVRSDGSLQLCFHNPAILAPRGDDAYKPPEKLTATDASPRWLFVIGSVDYAAQKRLFPGEAFCDIVVRKLEETLAAGRVPTLIAPVEIIELVRKQSAVADAAELLTYCEYFQFQSLLRDAEYVLYWNAVSFSGLLRTLLGKPWFTFDSGHLINTMSPEYVARITKWFYQGCEPPRLAVDDALTCEALQQATAEYRGTAERIRQALLAAPDPPSLLWALARGAQSPSSQTPSV